MASENHYGAKSTFFRNDDTTSWSYSCMRKWNYWILRQSFSHLALLNKSKSLRSVPRENFFVHIIFRAHPNTHRLCLARFYWKWYFSIYDWDVNLAGVDWVRSYWYHNWEMHLSNTIRHHSFIPDAIWNETEKGGRPEIIHKGSV